MALKTRKHIVKGNARLTAKGKSKKTTITVHETANTSRGANANAHARLQAGGNSRQASWHWQVDDKEAVQSYEHDDRCWHASSRALDSIAIEICVNRDGDLAQAYRNAIELIKWIMSEEGLEPRNVVQHYWWTKKNCPTNMRNGRPMNWDSFVDALGGKALKPSAPSTPSTSTTSTASKSIKELADEVIRGEHGTGSERKARLGSLYSQVQAEVNRQLGAQSTPSKPATNSGLINQLVEEVLAGKHGTGQARKRALGANYSAVQAEVNRRLTGARNPKNNTASGTISRLADGVIDGKYGTGAQRKRALGSNYAAVQAEVNRRLGVGGGSSRHARKSIRQLADEVLQGKHGTGDNRKRSLGSNYSAVQAEVNRRLGA